MTTPARRLVAFLLGLAVLAGSVPARAAEDDAPDTIDRTPPRLSYVEGEASFWRPGAEDWAPAQLNTPLAPGDELHTGNRGNLEMQVGGQAFVRSWGDTHLGVVDQQPDFLQLKVTTGHVVLDLRRLAPGHSIEVATPYAALTVDAPGYYRVTVGPDRTAFVVRRAGRATLTPEAGAPVDLAAGEQVILDGATVQRVGAPGPDVWDNWNDARTAHLLASTSARYVGREVYGAMDLDRYGAWRTEPSYGAVWVPAGVPAGWAPYSTGRWVADPYYGWTWVDTAPWGWAPYHYGRWVYLNGFWAWAPGPVVVRPVYAPALVAFFGSPGVQITVGSPFVSWVALGWGEPVVPWWRTSRWHGRPWWGGWGGPRYVNNVIVHRTTVIHVHQIREYRHWRVRNAVVAVGEGHFGRRAVQEARVRDVDVQLLRPLHGRLDVKPDRSSFVAAEGRGTRPPEQTRTRPIVMRRKGPDERDDRDRRETAPRARTEQPRVPESRTLPVPRVQEPRGPAERTPAERPPVARERKPTEPGRGPAERKPAAAERRPVEPERRPVDRERKPVEVERRPVGPERRPVPLERSPVMRERPGGERVQPRRESPVPEAGPGRERGPQPETPPRDGGPSGERGPRRDGQVRGAAPVVTAPSVQPRPMPRVGAGQPAGRPSPSASERGARPPARAGASTEIRGSSETPPDPAGRRP
ncbi:MAG TPA: DUF6600 domain-containing protein [Methylomirabilota bacterium]|nr:DUF6600 domain-containing protein [Methylomirabilota bacterium]